MSMSDPDARRAEPGSLRRLSLALGITWCLAFPVVGLLFSLQMFADGSIFSYAVAGTEAWSFHWHNISGRVVVWLYEYLAPQAFVSATGHAAGGVVLYGALHFIAPALSLLATRAADRSPGRVVFGFACGSTALLCPLVFGYPTEMWITHAAFWPCLALCLSSRRPVLTLLALLALVLSHEAGVVWAGAILCASLVQDGRQGLRVGALLALALCVWGAVKYLLPPDAYVAAVLGRNAWNLLDPNGLTIPLLRLIGAALAGYGLLYLLLARMQRGLATLLVAAGLVVWWVWFDTALHASDRYYVRTLLLGAVPLLGLIAAAAAMGWFAGMRRGVTRVATGALLLVSLIHVVETVKFVAGWRGYLVALEALATGTAADPDLGDARFVSAARIGADLSRLGWNSTTPFLSVLVAPGMDPARLVVDPHVGYFWYPCPTATAHAAGTGAVPQAARDLVRVYTCRHRAE